MMGNVFDMGFGGGIMWLFWILLVVMVVVWIVKMALKDSVNPEGRRYTALNILEERYARGEIDQEEFEQMKATGAIDRLDLAWSRDQGHKVYVPAEHIDPHQSPGAKRLRRLKFLVFVQEHQVDVEVAKVCSNDRPCSSRLSFALLVLVDRVNRVVL